MNKWKKLSDTFEKVIDYRGKTPKKIGGNWCDKGYRALSALNVKTSGLTEIDSIKCLDENLYKIWMKEEVKKGDILLTSEAPAGQVLIWDSDEKIVLSQRLFALRINEQNNNYFVKYFMQSDLGQKEIEKNSTGSTVFGISAKMFNLINIPDVDLSIQRKVGKLLKSLDDKIELNNQINADLEVMAKTLYDYWFVQFDFPDANGKPYKSSGGKMVYSKELKREIPEGWEVKELGKEFETLLGGTPSTENESFWNNGTVYWLNSGKIANFPIINSELKITPEAVSKSSTNLLPTGAVLLSITRHLRASILAIDACINQSVIGIKPSSYFKSNFLYPYLKNEIPRLMGLRTGAQQPHINKDIVDKSPIILPELSIIKHYNQKTEGIYNLIISNAKENQQLASLRDWLLPMLMNGQVGFKEDAKKETPIISLSQQDQRFEQWLSSQGLAARGEIDKATLREIFNLMDEEEYGK